MALTAIPVSAVAATAPVVNMVSCQVEVPATTFYEDEPIDVTIKLTGSPYKQGETPTDVVLVIDKSGSMGHAIADMKTAAIDFVNAIDTTVHRIGIVEYESIATAHEITDDKTALIDTISAITAGGGTSIADGIKKATALLDSSKRANADGAIVLMTDGQSNLPLALAQAEIAKSKNYSFFTVALVADENSDENKNLKKMATSEADHYFRQLSSMLPGVYKIIAAKIGDVNAKNVYTTQNINTNFELVADSVKNNIPVPTYANYSLRWEMTQLVSGIATLSYQVKPIDGIKPGTYTLSTGEIYYTDYRGERVVIDTPSIEINIVSRAPKITSVTPSTVDFEGGDKVTITGQYFKPGLQIYLDSVTSTPISYTYVSDTELKFTMPEHSVSSSTKIYVKNPDGKFASTTIKVAASFAVLSVTPDEGEPNVRQKVTVTGAGFSGTYKTVKVQFGTTYSTSIFSVSNTDIVCFAPPLAEGTYDVTVYNSDGTSATLKDGYTIPAPAVPAAKTCKITSVSPSVSEENVKQKVTITGELFNGTYKTAKVLFGTEAGSIFSVSDTEIIVSAPALSAGSYDVTVQNADGTSATKAGAYTVNAPLVNTSEITAISPNTAEENTKQKITITGKEFKGTYKTLSVKFGTEAGSIFSVSDTEIIVMAPALAAGSYDVTVTNSDGTSVTKASGYTVTSPPAPTCEITSVSVTTGEENVKQKLTITGKLFNGTYKTAQVLFGTEAGTLFSVSDTEIVVMAPALAAGTYDVTVICADGSTATKSGSYIVTGQPVETCEITSLSVTTAEENTAQSVTLTGKLFNGTYKTLKVLFGTTEATVSTLSDTSIVCRAPKLAAGVYDVQVINADGTTATKAGAYTVTAAVVPTNGITGITPLETPTANKRFKIEIAGTGFKGTYKTISVYIGTAKATMFSVDLTAGIITVRVPALASGTYDVKVINADSTTFTLTDGLTIP